MCFRDGVKMDLECCRHRRALWAFIPSGAHHKRGHMLVHISALAAGIVSPPLPEGGMVATVWEFRPIQTPGFSKAFHAGLTSPGQTVWQPSGRLCPKPCMEDGFPIKQTEDCSRPPPQSTRPLILRQNLLNVVQRQSIGRTECFPPFSKQNAFRRS